LYSRSDVGSSTSSDSGDGAVARRAARQRRARPAKIRRP
jgi:hypothetical protein